MPSSRFIILLIPMQSRMYRPSSNSRTSNSRDEVTVKKKEKGKTRRKEDIRNELGPCVGKHAKSFKNDAMLNGKLF